MAERYEGWASYETWATSLWIHNDEDFYRYYSKKAEHYVTNLPSPVAAQELAKEMQEFFRKAAPTVEKENAVFWDLVQYALENVDWLEVSSSFIEVEDPKYSYQGPVVEEKPYIGEANFPTWAVYSWLNGDYSDDPEKRQNLTRKIVEQAAFEGSMQNLSTGFVLDTMLKEHVEGAFPKNLGGLWIDLFHGALSDVDWKSLSDSFSKGYGLSGSRRKRRK